MVQLRPEGEIIELAFYDELARLTRNPDTTFAELRQRYEADVTLRVPPTVHNALLNAPEDITWEMACDT